MRYTKERLQYPYSSKNNIVVHIETKEQYNKLKELCPKMTGYNEDYKYYLTTNGGYGKERHLYEGSKLYLIIEFSEIDFGEDYEIY